MQSFAIGHLNSWKTLVRGAVRNPERLAVFPNVAGKPDALWKCSGTSGRLELGEQEMRLVPHFEAAKHVRRGIDAPDRAHHPIQAVANRFQNARRGIAERCGIGQHRRDCVSGGDALFGALAFGDVARHRENHFFVGPGRGIPQQPFVGAVLAAVAIFKQDRARAGIQFFRFGQRGRLVFGMDKIEIGAAEKFVHIKTQCFRPCGVQAPEISVKIGQAEQVQRKCEEMLEFLFGALALRDGGGQHMQMAAQLHLRYH